MLASSFPIFPIWEVRITAVEITVYCLSSLWLDSNVLYYFICSLLCFFPHNLSFWVSRWSRVQREQKGLEPVITKAAQIPLWRRRWSVKGEIYNLILKKKLPFQMKESRGNDAHLSKHPFLYFRRKKQHFPYNLHQVWFPPRMQFCLVAFYS